MVENANLYQCPICKQSLVLMGNSFMCDNRHTFDRSKTGYVNLMRHNQSSAHYTKESFVARQQVLEAGLYSHIKDFLISTLQKYNPVVVVDAGCGEGYYTRELARVVSADYYAFDVSKESVVMASKKARDLSIHWFVSDMTAIALQNQSVSCILNIFSPGNYAEFDRILVDEGIVIKVVPTSNHLKQLRTLNKQTANNYSNDKVVSLFSKHYNVILKERVSLTVQLTPNLKEALLKMTPLLFTSSQNADTYAVLKEITIEAEILVGLKQKKTTS